MVRTVVSLDPEDKAWLDRKARQEGVPMTEIVRQAVRQLRERSESAPRMERLLEKTRGMWKGDDGLAYQRRLRREWDRRR